jgi:separase
MKTARELELDEDGCGGSGAARSSDAYYVLNPGGDLARTQATFETAFAEPPWEGVAGRPPPTDAVREAVQRRDLYVYCGHGDGGQYLPAGELERLPRCSAALLMGCSSGALRAHGRFAPSGMALSYLRARCPALVANLWDVTDGDVDRLCQALLIRSTRNGGSLLAAVAAARPACRLSFLTGAAAVCYGVPLDFMPKGAPSKRLR